MEQQQELLTLLNRRINAVTALIKQQDADAMIIYNQANYRYLTNFTGEEAELILTKDGDRYLLSDSRFADQIKAQAPGEMTVIMKHDHNYREISKVLQQIPAKRVLVEGEFVSAIDFQHLQELNPNSDLIMCEELVERVRNIKDDLEIAALRKAIAISMESFNGILPMIKPGESERAIGAKLDYLFKVNGGDGPSFETIIASGERSAWAHGVASDKKLRLGELIVIDFGSFYNGYAADITRTVALGEVDQELKKIYDIVHEAQRRGIAAAKVGNTGADVDRAARDYINEQGYGQYFGHGIGHGIGLEIHELCQPALPFRKQALVNKMVHTVEPGIYLPGKGGVRIEDDVLINNDQPEVLSTLPKDELLSL
ncbi:M24 family metallopeptidase [Lactobacillus gigeriorum]|uniref:Putative prolidase n=1 Tax=Lactobacillus gigeriorum DSM 23908 = CRBIP 24.85 TaxID=1423751 RepID=I7LEW9_9LACO|nr:Xaa-Pro peptidase family protein [Lactobacillus gigeriorum]KRN14117.1 x-pro dipeptidase family protein [Lactobacillus gigeriorum DSM 23908 = CRBIP 24.85]CCI86148.1 Putative prolidase [Lactobacillus gigeriorum DSM 23908 = CRBIP 24.85]